MDGRVWRAGLRFAAVAGAFALVTGAMATSAQNTLVLASQGRIKFFLGAAALGAVLPRIGRALMADHVSATDVHTGAVTCGLLGIVLAAMSAVTAQSAAHLAPPADATARVIFDNLYILYCMGLLVTAVPSDARAMWDKWVKIGRAMLVVAALMVALSYADGLPAWIRARSELHDVGGAAPDADGRP